MSAISVVSDVQQFNATLSELNSVISKLPILVSKFQKKEGNWLTSNCQHIQIGNIHYYGIHKDQQMQASFSETANLYKCLKSHVLRNLGCSPDTEVIQVVGDSASFSPAGTERGKSFLREKLTDNSVVLYGFTGHEEADGTRCVNACVTDVVREKGMTDKVVANLVGFHTPTALKQWNCTGPNELEHYVIVYGDDESKRETGTLFGDDVTSSDFFADRLWMLDGGAQSFRQAVNTLLLDRPITVLSGLRAESKAYATEGSIRTPYFAAAKFLQEILQLLANEIDEEGLKNWYKEYFGQEKCYIGDPKRGDFCTKQKLLDEAWDLFIQEKLYKRLPKLVTLTKEY